MRTRPEQPEMRLFPEAGYGVVQHTNAHLIVSAAFHSRAHKHADDGTFVWFDRGNPLIVDSGRYGYGRVKQTDEQRNALSEKGYWYSDPKRIYIESTHAHSTVEIDGESDNRAQAEFYGSALKQGIARDDGTFYFHLEIPRSSGTVMQHRAFVYQPGEWLLIIDKMVSHDDNLRGYTSWLQLDTGARRLAASANWASFQLGDETLTITALSPNTTIRLAKGETKPRLAGWRSPRGGVLLPAWSVGIDAPRANKTLIANLLSLNGPPQSVGTGKSIMTSMPDGTIKFEWLNSGKSVLVRLCKDWTANPDQCNQI